MIEEEQAKALFLAGIERIQKEDYASAAQNFRESLKLVPGRASTLDNLSVCLMKLGKLVEAEETCRASLAVDEASPTAWFNLGLVQQVMDKSEEAIASFQKSISRDPNFPDSWHYSGLFFVSRKRYREAVECFEKVLALDPGNVEAMCMLSSIFSELGFYFSAMATIEKALALAPHNPSPYIKKGLLHKKLNQIGDAISSLKKGLELNPSDRESAEYSLAAMTGEAIPTRTPLRHVVSLFDDYADRFEKHLVDKLGYQSPRILFQHLEPLLKSNSDIIDLGCGTGLMGALLKSKAKTLVGVDLSRKMLDKAGEKNIYDLLIWGEVDGVLSNREDTYDAAIASDVFCYIGDLSKTFTYINTRLRKDGLFAFCVESFDGDGFKLKPTMRYGHSVNYIRELANTYNFKIHKLDHDLMRLEAKEPDGKVMGYYVVLQKTQAPIA